MFWSLVVAVAVVLTLVPVVVQVELLKEEATPSLLARLLQLKLAPEDEALNGVRAFMELMVASQNLDPSLFLVVDEVHLGIGHIQTGQARPIVQLWHQ
jgi:hypothetical protein